MAFKNFIDGVTLPAADINTYLAKQAVIVCTSGSRPSPAVVGMTIYETDTARMLVYAAATATWQPPWNMPWGVVGYSTLTAASSTVSAMTDSGLSVTWTAVANRRYNLRFQGNVAGTVATDLLEAHITDTTPTIKGRSLVVVNSTTTAANHNISTIEVGIAAGSTTRKVRHGRNTGTGTSTMYGGVGLDVPTFFVEDIGPNANPV